MMAGREIASLRSFRRRCGPGELASRRTLTRAAAGTRLAGAGLETGVPPPHWLACGPEVRHIDTERTRVDQTESRTE